MAFLQDPPALENSYRADPVLSEHLSRVMPPDVLGKIELELDDMGELSATTLAELATTHRLDEPRLDQWDAWGRRVDRVVESPAWATYARVAAERGLVAAGYERASGPWSRLHQFALVYLFAPSSQLYTCPLAMTDGCARTLEKIGEAAARGVFERLTSRDPAAMWTSGQWMTERTGGSDVGLSETVARHDGSGNWRLYGTKWFTSAVSSQVALTLARPEGNGPGGKGLALFLVHVRDESGGLNGIAVHRLKDKLGTRQLPTAELGLEGTLAVPLAGDRDGIRNMAHMLDITRTWNAVCAVAGMGRGLSLARDFAKRRVAFGAPLSEKPLHLDTLAGLAAEHEAATHLVLHEVGLMGRVETGEATEDEKRLLSGSRRS